MFGRQWGLAHCVAFTADSRTSFYGDSLAGPKSPMIDPRPERRAERRHLTFLNGRLFYGSTLIEVPCIIKNTSPSGARVRLQMNDPIPLRLWLLNVRANTVWDALTVWREGLDLGVVCIGEHDVQASNDADVSVIKRVWLALKPD